MTEPRTRHERMRPTPRTVLVVLLIVFVYGAGANIGAGTVLLLAAGMGVGTIWSVVGFLRRVDRTTVRGPGEVEATEGAVAVTVPISVPRGVIGVIRLVPTLPDEVAVELQRLLGVGHAPASADGWATLPRSGASAQVELTTVLARGDAQQLAIELELTDVFGLVRRRRTLPSTVADVTAAPGAAAPFAADTTEGAEDDGVSHALAANGAPCTELRPWRAGEGVRSVHWAASERAGHLLVRPRGPETRQRRTLHVEDRVWPREQLDARCRDLTATADGLVRAGVEVEVEAAGQLLPWGPDARRLLTTLRPNAASIASPPPHASSRRR